MHFLQCGPSDTAVPYGRDALFMFANQLILCMIDELLADLPSLLEWSQRWPDLMDSLLTTKLNVQLYCSITFTAAAGRRSLIDSVCHDDLRI